MVEKLSPKDKKAIKELFEQFDKDNNGTLSAKELEESLFLCQRNPTPKELKKLTKELGIKNDKVSFKDFECAMAKYFLDHPDPETELKNAFKMFDKDKSGYVDKNELKFALKTLGEKSSAKEIERMFNDLDANKDGKINYTETGTSTMIKRLVSSANRRMQEHVVFEIKKSNGPSIEPC